MTLLFAAVISLVWDPVFGPFIARAQEARLKSALADLRTKIDIFYAHNRRYPARLYDDMAAGGFLDTRDGVPSLGRFVIPETKDAPGHDGALYHNASSEDAVAYLDGSAFDDRTPIGYVMTGRPATTRAYINCTHPSRLGSPRSHY